MYALLQVVLKEFFQLRQDKKMIPVMIVGPLVQLIALGFAANQDVSLVPMVLVDQDRSAASRDLVNRFTSAGYFEIKGSEETAARVEPCIVAPCLSSSNRSSGGSHTTCSILPSSFPPVVPSAALP